MASIVEGTEEGLEAARAAGTRLGHPGVKQVRHAPNLLAQLENPVASITRRLGASRSTLYKHVPELVGGRHTLTGGTGRNGRG